jgi:uncharacterized protein (TIGR03437 family)
MQLKKFAMASSRPLLAVLFLALTPCGYPAGLSIADQVLNSGEIVSTPVSFSANGQTISGVQFDIQWDQSLSIRIEGGGLIGQASKILYTASLATNRMRCLIVGINQRILTDGALVNLFVTVNSSAAGTTRVTLMNTIATDPYGGLIPLQPATANFTVLNGPVSQRLPGQGILNAASLLPAAAAPGEILTLLGSFSATASPSVSINGTAAPLTFATSGQLSAVVPFGLNLSGPADLKVQSQNQTIAEVTVPVAPTAPAIFTQTNSGSGPGLVFNEDCTQNSPSNPAAPGSILVIYGTGFGQVSPAIGDGQVASQPAVTILPVTAAIAGIAADVTYAGTNPGSIAGLFVINVKVPSNPSSEPFAPLTLAVGSAATQPGVTVSLQ